MKLHQLLPTAALVASLALSGAAMANEPAKDGVKKHHARFEETLAKLPEAKQKIFREAMEKSKTQNKDLWAQGKKLREEQKAILMAEKFDKAAYLAKSKEMDDLRDKMDSNRNEAFASVAGQLTPEERVMLAKSHRGGKHHKKDGAENKPQAE